MKRIAFQLGKSSNVDEKLLLLFSSNSGAGGSVQPGAYETRLCSHGTCTLRPPPPVHFLRARGGFTACETAHICRWNYADHSFVLVNAAQLVHPSSSASYDGFRENMYPGWRSAAPAGIVFSTRRRRSPLLRYGNFNVETSHARRWAHRAKLSGEIIAVQTRRRPGVNFSTARLRARKFVREIDRMRNIAYRESSLFLPLSFPFSVSSYQQDLSP